MSSATDIAKAVKRVDAPKKVIGEATYAGEFFLPDMLYGWVVSSPIARGEISSVKDAEALALPGVHAVLTHLNAPALSQKDEDWQDDVAPGGSPFKPFQSAEVVYSGQPLALVVADSLELARYASRLVSFEFQSKEHQTDASVPMAPSKEASSGKMGFQPPPDTRGEPDQVWKDAASKMEADYVIPAQHHNPMEPHATLARWEGDRLTVWSKTQGVVNSRNFLAAIFQMDPSKVEVKSPFVGGAFGSGLRPQYQVVLAAMAAKNLGRPVRVTLTRPQMFTFGHRPYTTQTVKLATAPDHSLSALVHEVKEETSQFEDYTETVVNWSGTLYRCPNASFDHRLVPVDLYTPLDMRAPGGATGVHALECAIDEMAYEIGQDPLAFRLANDSEVDGNDGKPYSSKKLKECLQQASEKFGWAKRTMAPGSMSDGNELIGWGVASGIWEVMYMPASVKARLTAEGQLTISTASSDIGTGTYTIITQLASEYAGVPLEKIDVKIGDSSLPEAPLQGGSMTAASIGTAVQRACFLLVEELVKLKEKNQLKGSLTPSQILRELGETELEVTAYNAPDGLSGDFAKYAHTASFVEVRVDRDLGSIRVSRVVTATAAGRILNARTARSQVAGCVVWGIGFALSEESVVDHRYGRFINHDLAEYHVAVNADVPDAEVIFVHEDDPLINPLGVKGIGEVGLVGLSAAIANAVFHATGKRVRTLPIQLDDLL